MDLSPGWSVLEVGCGPGFFTPALAATAPAVLVALDLQTTMLHWLRGRAETSSVNADAMALPFAARSFNAAVVATMLGEVPSPEHCLAEIHRVLKPGGVLCIAETRRDSDFIRLAALCALAEPRGFRLVGHRGPRWQYVARFAKQ